MFPQQGWPAPASGGAGADGEDDGDTSHRPPNAFILYSQAMRSSCRQQNPSLSNTEVSRLLGKMWKEVPSDVKVQYKQKAAVAQEQFKREHPNYTYRKARKKRALNELLTKSAQGFPLAGFPADGNFQAMMAGGQPQYMMQMYAQGQFPGGQMLQQQAMGIGAQGAQPQAPPGVAQGYAAYPGMQQQQQGLYQYQPTK
jgi:transcription factor SOX7/8/10/18 (SOX group E/F)